MRLLALPAAAVRPSLVLAGVYGWKTRSTSDTATTATIPAAAPPLPPAAAAAAATAYSAMASTPAAPTGEASVGREGGERPMLARHRSPDAAAPEAPDVKASAKRAFFPLGYRDGLSQWWAGLSPAVTEHRVLSYMPHLQKPPTHASAVAGVPAGAEGGVSEPGAVSGHTDAREDPYGPRQWQSNMVALAGKNRLLNEFSIERLGEGEPTNRLVMLHGYGAGLGFFYKNFEALSRLPHWKLYALDMLGMGRSSRPSFHIHAKDKQGKIREAENWFIDALEEWRVKRGIDKFTLLGHSLGGYMAVCYALKYPGHLDKLILASPVGVPEDPYAMNEDLPEPGDSTMGNEFTQTQDETMTDNPPAPGHAGSPNPKKMTETNRGKGTPRKPLPKWLTTLWDANVSPFSFVRLSGPLGPRLVSAWTSRRFSHLPPEEAQSLHDYSYSLFRQRGSGEYALAYILAPGAFARSPLIRRIQGVGRQYLEAHTTPDPDPNASTTPTAGTPAKLRETGIPVVLMYGENDWMDVAGGLAAQEKLNAEQRAALATATTRERKLENGSAKVTIIRKAGHHVYLDGFEQFNEEVLREMKDVEVRQKRLAAIQ